MTLEELRLELSLIIQDSGLNTYASYLTSWINTSVTELSNEFSFPELKLNDPVILTITEDDWLYDLPATYQKMLYKCYDSEWSKISIHDSMDSLDSSDIEHTDTGDHVTQVAVRGSKIGVYPMAAEDIKLWYYKKPTALAAPADELTCIPEQYHSVVITKIILKNFHLFSEKLLDREVGWWENKYRGELFGDGSNIGMINCLARDKKVRRTGGRQPLS